MTKKKRKKRRKLKSRTNPKEKKKKETKGEGVEDKKSVDFKAYTDGKEEKEKKGEAYNDEKKEKEKNGEAYNDGKREISNDFINFLKQYDGEGNDTEEKQRLRMLFCFLIQEMYASNKNSKLGQLRAKLSHIEGENIRGDESICSIFHKIVTLFNINKLDEDEIKELLSSLKKYIKRKDFKVTNKLGLSCLLNAALESIYWSKKNKKKQIYKNLVKQKNT
jgi:hypothetical protein